MIADIPRWGTEITKLDVDGRVYRIYEQRPRLLGEVLELAARWGDRPYIVQGDRVLNFEGFLAAVERRRRDLLTRGVRPGDRIAVLGWNSPEWIVNFWAVIAVRGVAVLMNAWWSQTELNEALRTTGPALVLVDEKLRGKVEGDYTLAPWSAPDDPEGVASLGEAVTEGDENDEAVVIFTSGTSGSPKAVLLSNRALLSGLQMLLHITRRLPHQVDSDVGEAALHTGPMFHVGGVQTLLRAVCVGDTLVMPEGKFDPAEALRLIEAWRVRRWSAVPTMLTRVVEHPDVQLRDVSTLRSLTVGGAAAHPELLERIRTGLTGVEPRIATGFGLTENGGQAVAASGKDTVAKPGSTGRALPCVEIRIAEAPDGTDGEIQLRSPTQMSRYIGVSADPIDSDGWLSTGDLGKLDDEGYLWITGRSKDMIIRGGENIAPAAIERALLQLPDIDDAVVFGIPDRDLGETVATVVVTNTALDYDDLRDRLRGVLASFAIPQHWLAQAEPFQENHAGKVERATVIAAARSHLLKEQAL